MPKMSVAGIAKNFNARHTVGMVGLVGHYVFFYRLGEGRPAGMTFKLSIGIEKKGIAANAGIFPGFKTAAHFT